MKANKKLLFASFMLIFLCFVLIPGIATGAAYDPECVSDSDCWAQSLGKAAGVQYTVTSCNDFCIENHGFQSLGKIVNNICQCQCKPGFKEDSSLVCVRSESSCNQDCRNYHAGRIYGANAYGKIVNGVCQCRCQEGYEPNENLACVEVFSEDDFDEINDDDAVWETFMDKCRDLREFTRGSGDSFTVTQQEFINYITRVEEANPGSSWKQILAALHVDKYRKDAFEEKLPILGTPLFEWGPETDGWEDVDLLCKAPLPSSSNPAWYTPKFVRTDSGDMTELGHAYGAIRVNLNRGSSANGTFIPEYAWTRIITHWGDYWQVIIHNWFLREKGDRFPPDQYRGNEMGIWLEKYYSQNPNAPLSEAFQAYFNK